MNVDKTRTLHCTLDLVFWISAQMKQNSPPRYIFRLRREGRFIFTSCIPTTRAETWDAGPSLYDNICCYVTVMPVVDVSAVHN